MEKNYTVADAATITGLPETTIRSWLQRKLSNVGHRTSSSRIRFSSRDLRVLRLMRELTEHGFSPDVAAHQAATVVDRFATWRGAPLAAVFARDPNVSPAIIPEEAIPPVDSLIIITLGALFATLPQDES